MQDASRRPDAFERAKDVRLEKEIAHQQQIKHAYSANLKVIQAEDRMLGSLLDRGV
ncbi:MAG: hypothetical protein MI748_17905 [Opitutales bacterium]|nr:hypothetical protein [Opitutales bacterium]